MVGKTEVTPRAQQTKILHRKERERERKRRLRSSQDYCVERTTAQRTRVNADRRQAGAWTVGFRTLNDILLLNTTYSVGSLCRDIKLRWQPETAGIPKPVERRTPSLADAAAAGAKKKM